MFIVTCFPIIYIFNTCIDPAYNSTSKVTEEEAIVKKCFKNVKMSVQG